MFKVFFLQSVFDEIANGEYDGLPFELFQLIEDLLVHLKEDLTRQLTIRKRREEEEKNDMRRGGNGKGGEGKGRDGAGMG